MSRRRPVFRGQRRPARVAGRCAVAGWLLLVLWLSACGDPRPLIDEGSPPPEGEELVRVEPGELSAFGNSPIRITQFQFAFDENEPVQVVLDARRCLDIQVLDGESLRCTPQGGPSRGGVWLSISQGRESLRAFGALRFLPPHDPLFARMVALGGSLTAGVSGAALSPDTQRTSIPALLARRTQGYFPMPLLARPGLPPEPPLTRLDPLTGFFPADWEREFFGALGDGISADAGRVDPDLTVQQLALPQGPDAFALAQDLPYGDLGAIYARTLLPGLAGNPGGIFTHLERISPSLVFAGFDLFDTLGVYTEETDEPMNREQIQAHLEELLDRLVRHAPGALLVVMNLPPGNWWPGRDYDEWRRYMGIWTNRALHDAALLVRARRPGTQIVLVDTFSFIFQVLEFRGEVERFGQRAFLESGANGETDLVVRDAGGREQVLGFDPMQGIFSLDGRTLTATGNGLLANLVIETLNREIGPASPRPLLGAEIPYLDIGALLADDPQSPAALAQRLEGLAIVSPERLADPEALPALHTAHLCAMGEIPGLSPPPERCPVSLSISDTQGNAPQARAGATAQFVVTLRGPGGRALEGYPLAFHARNGRLSRGAVRSDERGYATLHYNAPAVTGHDILTLACGNVTLRAQIPITE